MQDGEFQRGLYEALGTLNISSRAIDLYVLVLQIGQVSVTELSHKLDMARPNVYKIIRELHKEGLIIESEKSKISGPVVVSPSVLLKKVREKEQKYAKIGNVVSRQLPELLSIYAQGSAPSKIKVFEGREQYIKAFELIFEEVDSTMKFFGSAEDFVIFTQWHGYNKLVKKRIKKNIKLQSLLVESETAQNMKRRAMEELREVKIIKNCDVFSTSFQLFSKKILLWQPHTPAAILIEDEYITQMMQSMFDYIWNNSK